MPARSGGGRHVNGCLFISAYFRFPQGSGKGRDVPTYSEWIMNMAEIPEIQVEVAIVSNKPLTVELTSNITEEDEKS